MIPEWLPAAEQIVVRTTIQGIRTLGFVSAQPGSGVTRLSRTVGEVLAKTASRVLYVDLASSLADSAPRLRPTAPLRSWREPVPDQSTSMYWTAPLAGAGERFAFEDALWLRSEFEDAFAQFSHIIIDMAALISDGSNRINPIAAAAASDAIILVCARGRIDAATAEDAVEILRSVHANLVGTVMNEADYDPPGDEMARAVRRWLPRFGATRRLSNRIADSALLR